MLVLSRKCEESLIINDEIEIKIIEIVGDKVRLGIEAPKNYKILRKELVQTMENNQQAAKPVFTKDLMSFIAELKKSQNDEEN
ncbi:MAG: carbon storage regulator CsrA [Oscillospiraceae bacterium]